MLDFMFELERVLKIWPEGVKWSLVQIADYTNTPMPYAVDFLTEALNKAIDIHEPMSFNEVNKALGIMMERKRGDIEARRQKELQAVEKAVQTYQVTMEKVRVMQASKNWRGAYLTLAYFHGLNKDRLPADVLVQLCDDCLRLGIKADINFQELSQWLGRGVRTLLKTPTEEALEDALDFLDAYGDHFIDQANGKGGEFLTNLFLTLKPAAMEFDLMPKLNTVAGELKLNAVMDVVI